MEKVCVFCGNPPENKNKEHIIPKWLLKLTGKEHSEISIGSHWGDMKEIVFNISAFTFPSCTKCNTDFSKKEGLVKPIIEKIIEDHYVDIDELILLLDWFDKIRISLWLGIQFLNKGVFNMVPKYYINTRLRLKDRFLAITNCYDNTKTLKWIGVNTLCFIMSPTCVTLKINNVIFTNCSSDFVISRQLGFPYPIFERPNPNSELTDFQFTYGTNEVMNRLFKSNLYQPNIIISQPIFKESMKLQPKFYDNEYVKTNSYNYENGEGMLFATHDNFTYVLQKDEEYPLGAENPKPMLYKLNRPTLEFHIELFESKNYNLELLNEDEKKAHFEGLNGIINYTKEQIRQYDY
ncbi:MAG: hypothetical protein ACLQQ4_04050 [Bacteroidia bacterium]